MQSSGGLKVFSDPTAQLEKVNDRQVYSIVMDPPGITDTCPNSAQGADGSCNFRLRYTWSPDAPASLVAGQFRMICIKMGTNSCDQAYVQASSIGPFSTFGKLCSSGESILKGSLKAGDNFEILLAFNTKKMASAKAKKTVCYMWITEIGLLPTN